MILIVKRGAEGRRLYEGTASAHETLGFYHENSFYKRLKITTSHGTLPSGMRYITCVACVAFGRRKRCLFLLCIGGVGLSLFLLILASLGL